MLRTGTPILGMKPLVCECTVNCMKNSLFPVLCPVVVAVLLLVSGCGGSSGVELEPSRPTDEPAQPGAGDDVVTPPSDGGGEVDVPGPGPVAQPSDDPAPVLLPAPVNLRASRYSDSAGEVFWEAADGLDGDIRYVVSLDGNEMASVSSLSYFTESLQAGTEHRLSVIARDANGGSSVPASIAISAQIDVPPPVYDFMLGVDRTRAALEEGADEGVSFVIRAVPEGRETINLQVQGQRPADAADIIVELDRQTLEGEQLQAALRFRMPVGMRPIQTQERRFNVVASSGDQVRITELILDIKPVAAPDVYLLIGQSNMVGSSKQGAKNVSPGGLDERHERIWQLNVAPNNTSIFSGFQDFVNESNTVIEPHFIEAEDPLHDPRNPVVSVKGGTTVGPGLSFAKAALSDTTQRIYLVPAAWGASGFCQVAGEQLAWNAGVTDNLSLGGTGLLERALTRLRITLRETGGVLRGVLWHQGGADSNDQACADAYAQNLKLMVERIRREVPVDARGDSARGSQAPIPFIVATQSRGVDERGDYSLWPSTKSQVDAVHRNISSLLPYADWVNNDDLVPPAYPCGSSSCVHFGAVAGRETGRRYYEALRRIWQR